jgi:hypothetical protein
MALVGYQIEKDKIEARIRELHAAVKGRRGAVATSSAGPSTGRRELSAGARARIAAAQKKRWAEHRKQKAQAAKAAKVQAAG